MSRTSRATAGVTMLLMLGWVAAACSLVTDLDGYAEPRKPGTDGGDDSASPSNDGATTTDATGDEGGAKNDSGGEPLDGAGPSDPCADPTVLLGSNNLDNVTPDDVPHFALDAYGYSATTGGVARCLWIYVAGRPSLGKVRVGVYTEGPDAKPQNFVTSVTLENVVDDEWNKAPLPAPITINMGDRLWLGVAAGEPPPGPDVEVVQILYKETGCVAPFGRAADIGSTFPPVFEAHTVFDGACNALMYLGR